MIVLLLVTGPSVAGFAGRQATLAYVFAAVMLATAIFTRYPLGIIKAIGFSSHGVIEIILALLILVLPWVANFSRGILSRNFYVAMGLLMLLIWGLTDFRGVRDRDLPVVPPA